ncbi:MAG: ABC transporter substrate-binding protein [Anaerolineaceae bacterium]
MTTLGKYELHEQLGRGGFGIVYRATDTTLGREVALKVLHPQLTTDPDFLERFRDEARLVASLHSPNIVTIYELAEEEGRIFIAMEYLSGGSLKGKLEQNGVIPFNQTSVIMKQICGGLRTAHKKGLVHRDIKPANILFDDDGRAVIGDFGLARAIQNSSGQGSSSGGAVGTPAYRAPELWNGKPPASPATDIYSLACVLYEMLSGKVLFDGPTTEVVITQHLVKEPQIDDSFSPAIQGFLRKSLAKNPEERYENVDLFFKDLENLEQQEVPEKETEKVTPEKPIKFSPTPVPTKPPMTPGPKPEPVPLIKRKNWPWFAAGLIGLALLGIGISFAFPGKFNPGIISTGSPTLVAASNPTEDAPAAYSISPGDELKIAILAPLTGPVPAFGVSVRNGALMAIDEWNTRGGVLGKKIVPIVEDSQCTADPAVSAANKVINEDGVKFIIGEVCSGASIPVSEIANAQKVLMISPTSTNTSVTVNNSGATKPYIFRACFIDPFQGIVAARFALQTIKADSVFILYNPDDEYVRGLAESFGTAFVDGGGIIVGKEPYSSQDTDFSAILAKISEAKPDLVYLPDYFQIANLVSKQANEKGILIPPFMGGDGWDSSDLDLNTLNGSYFTNHYSPDSTEPEVIAFVRDYGSLYKDEAGQPSVPDAIAVLGYDAANLLLEAIMDAGSDDTDAVRKELETGIFNLVTGTLTMDEFHNPVKSAVVLGIKDGKVMFVQKIEPK